jgi:nitrate/TMAO reductase-like tetraheme cytochrome c subunit
MTLCIDHRVALLIGALFVGLTFCAPSSATATELGKSEVSPSVIPSIDFPGGAATPSEICGACHQKIYQEYSQGFGGDLHWPKTKTYWSSDPAARTLAGVVKGVFQSATAHAAAGTDPWPIEARRVEEHGQPCNVCHYPQAYEDPDIAATKIPPPKPRADRQEAGITCASCHITPDGKIRGPYAVNAPHATVQDERTATSAACALCHSAGERVVGKQTQTFLEWREDFKKAGLGTEQCQDCHMPKTVRKLAENFDVPERVVARHLWTGGHSFQRTANVLNLAIVQEEEGKSQLAFYVTNVGAGHSVPTGSNRRAIYLIAEVVGSKKHVVASKEWMFAPWFGNRPDDKAFVEEDKKGPEPVAATQADMQGPHETIIRAGEERVLKWMPELATGRYTVRARLVYDLNRYNDRAFKDDQHELVNTALQVTINNGRVSVR